MHAAAMICPRAWIVCIPSRRPENARKLKRPRPPRSDSGDRRVQPALTPAQAGSLLTRFGDGGTPRAGFDVPDDFRSSFRTSRGHTFPRCGSRGTLRDHSSPRSRPESDRNASIAARGYAGTARWCVVSVHELVFRLAVIPHGRALAPSRHGSEHFPDNLTHPQSVSRKFLPVRSSSSPSVRMNLVVGEQVFY